MGRSAYQQQFLDFGASGRAAAQQYPVGAPKKPYGHESALEGVLVRSAGGLCSVGQGRNSWACVGACVPTKRLLDSPVKKCRNVEMRNKETRNEKRETNERNGVERHGAE